MAYMDVTPQGTPNGMKHAECCFDVPGASVAPAKALRAALC